jgi:predicted HD phosphohydrolase
MGGRRPGSGRPSKAALLEKKNAAELARALLEAEVRPVVAEYLRLCKGGAMKKHQSAQTTRHYIERFVPAAKQFLQVDGEMGFEALIAQLVEVEEKEALAKAQAAKPKP